MTFELKSAVVTAEEKRKMEETIKQLGVMADPKLKNQTSDDDKLKLLKIMHKILGSHPHEAIRRPGDWLPVVVELSLSPDSKDVRDKASAIIRLVADHAQQYPNMGGALRIPVKESIAPLMKTLITGPHAGHVIVVWATLIKILGKSVHQGASVLNALLEVITRCFGMKDSSLHKRAYKAWESLIENFATDMDVLASSQRLTLTLKPLSAGPCKTEEVATAKLLTWWNLLVALRNRLERNFSNAAFPFLRFCMGGECELISVCESPEKSAMRTPNKRASSALQVPGTPGTPKFYLLDRQPSPCKLEKALPAFGNLQAVCGEILLKFVCRNTDGIDKMQLPALAGPCISKQETIEKYCSFLIQCLRFWAAADGASEIEDRWEIVRRVWVGLISLSSEFVPESEMSGQIVEDMLFQFKTFLQEVQVPQNIFLAIFEAFLDNFVGKIENLSFDCDELSKDGPALFLLRMSVDQFVGKDIESEDLNSVLNSLVDCTFNTPQLALLDTVELFLEELGRACEQSCQIKSLSAGLWVEMSQRMVSALQPTKEINQGDNLQHKFSSAYTIMAFPFCFSTGCDDMRDTRTLVATWKSLYVEISSCIMLVASTKDNTCCEEFSYFLLKQQNVDFKNSAVLYLLSEAVLEMLSSFSFKSSTAPEDLLSLSPTKSGKKQQRLRPLGALTSVVELLKCLLSSLVDRPNTEEAATFSNSTVTNCLAGVSNIFEHANTISDVASLISLIETLSGPVANLIKEAGSKDNKSLSFKGYQLKKLDRCTSVMLESVQKHYSGPYDSQLLDQLAALLQAMLCSPRRQLKTEAVDFWNKSFAKATHLQYPDYLRATLNQVKDKLRMHLPGFDGPSVQPPVVTPSNPSDATMPIVEFEMLNVPVANRLSPHKVAGSYLRRGEGSEPRLRRVCSPLTDTPPASKQQPVSKSEQKSSASRNKKRLELDDVDKEFVVIEPSKKKMALTERQKERFNDRQEFPYLDNNTQPEAQIPSMFMESQSPDLQVEFQNDDVVPESPPNRRVVRRYKSDTALVTEPSADSDDGDVISSSQPVTASRTSFIGAIQRRINNNDSATEIKDTLNDPCENEPPTAEEVDRRSEAGGSPVRDASPARDTSFRLSSVSPTKCVNAVDTPTKYKKKIPVKRRRQSGTRFSRRKPRVSKERERDPSPVTSEPDISQFSDTGSSPSDSKVAEVVIIDDEDDSGNEGDDERHAAPVQEEEKPTEDAPTEAPLAEPEASVEIVEQKEPVLEPDENSVEIIEPDDDIKEVVPENISQTPTTPVHKRKGILKRAGSLLPEEQQSDSPLTESNATAESASLDSTPQLITDSARKRRVHFSMNFDSLSDSEMQPRSPSKKRRKIEAPEEQLSALSPSVPFVHRFHHRTQQLVLRAMSDTSVAPIVLPEERCIEESHVTEKQLDATKPIFPALEQCNLDVTKILPNLCTGAGSRGLQMVLSARGVSTIGQFASLTEVDINQLPIKPPKLTTVRNALGTIEIKTPNDCVQSENSSKADTKDNDMEVPVDNECSNEKDEDPVTKDDVVEPAIESAQVEENEPESGPKLESKSPEKAEIEQQNVAEEKSWQDVECLAVNFLSKMSELEEIDLSSLSQQERGQLGQSLLKVSLAAQTHIGRLL